MSWFNPSQAAVERVEGSCCIKRLMGYSGFIPTKGQLPSTHCAGGSAQGFVPFSGKGYTVNGPVDSEEKPLIAVF